MIQLKIAELALNNNISLILWWSTNCVYRTSKRKRNFARRNKTDLGPRWQIETSLKIEDLRTNKTTGKLSSEVYVDFTYFFFLNKLKIVENTKTNKKNQNIRIRLRIKGPLEIHRPLLGSPRPGPMYRMDLTLMGSARCA